VAEKSRADRMINEIFWLPLPPMNSFLIALKGMAMGIAEVIPGVSGGTIAFITGIYERLINVIKSILGPALIRAWRNGGVSEVWRQADGGFLTALLAGMAGGLIFGVFVVTHLLEHYPLLLWAFFFGLIVASAIYIGRQVRRWTGAEVLALVIGVALAYYITIATPAQGSEALPWVFLAGVIAISALILPGISGSFMLLLMGMYTLIIPSLKLALSTFDSRSLLIIGVFAAGCLLGLATFSRVLSYAFRRFPNTTLALLTGFMIGSLNKIWPWRQTLSYRLNSRGEEVPLLERSVPPHQFDGDPMIIAVVLVMLLGFFGVFLLDRLAKR
jgi:putative membrane protein